MVEVAQEPTSQQQGGMKEIRWNRTDCLELDESLVKLNVESRADLVGCKYSCLNYFPLQAYSAMACMQASSGMHAI